MTCGLCNSTETSFFFRDEKRQWDYFQCNRCELIFRDPQTYLSHEEERKRYETHQNSMANKGYVQFLNPAVKLLLPHLKKGDRGLDFGCGPGPILDQLFGKEGLEVKNFDPYFFYHPQLLDEQYDFVTMTEVFEHMAIPSKEFALIHALMKPGAYLLIMTEPYQDLAHFKTWSYPLDPTHICFLNSTTIDWLAQHWGYERLETRDRLFLLRKKEQA